MDSSNMRISLDLIQTFLVVSEYQNMTKAAFVMNVTQPLLSQRINSLENTLGIKLFYREKNRLFLTPAGTLLRVRWAKLLNQFQDSIEELEHLKQNKEDDIRLGFSSGLRISLQVSLLQKLMAEFQAPPVSFESFPIYDLRARMFSEEVDAIVCPDYGNVCSETNLYCEILGYVRLHVALSKSHVLANEKFVKLQDLKDEVWLRLSSSVYSDYSQFMVSLSERSGITSPKFLDVKSRSMLQLMIASCKGCAISMPFNYEEGNQEIVTIPIEDISVPLVVVSNKPEKLRKGNVAKKIVEILREGFAPWLQ